MASKADFFASLSRCAIEAATMPEMNFASIDAPLREVFLQQLDAVGGTAGDGDSLADVDRLAHSLARGGSRVLSLVDGVSGNCGAAGIESPHQLASVDYTIAPARLGVAENGAVWIGGQDLVQRSAVFICEHLVVTLTASCIVGTLSDAVQRIGSIAGDWGEFISGPSKTADIEQSLVKGAHGARSCTVYLLAG